MKRIHYLLLGLLVSLCIAASSPTLPPTRIIAGSGVTVVTNSLNNFTLSAGGGSVTNFGALVTNLNIYAPAGGADAAVNIFNAAGAVKVGVDADGTFTSLGTNTFSGPILSSGNNTFTGTNTFTAEKFFPANNIGLRLLWSSPTNIYLASLATTANPTNAGDFAAITYLFKATVPPLLGSNSSIFITGTVSKTNANVTAADLYLYAGSSTNYVATGAGLFSTSAGVQTLSSAFPIFLNCNSFTVQLHGAAWSGTALSSTVPTNYTDTSAAFNLYVGARTTTSFTNLTIYGLRIFESYAP